MSWKDVKKRYPEAEVLSTNTGWDRPYGTNPYSGYDTGSPYLFKGEISPKTLDNLNPLDRVLLVEYKSKLRYYSYKSLRRKHVINDFLDNSKIVVFWTKGTASALDESQIKNGRDVGTANAFLSNLENIELSFYLENNLFKDNKTNSVWDSTGYAVSGPMEGKKLELITGTQHFWFSAAAFFPYTE